MTAKEYLSQSFLLNQQIDSKLEQVRQLNDLAQKCTAAVSGMPRNPNRGNSQLENTVCKIVDLKNEINSDIDRLVRLKIEIAAAIQALDNPDERIVLEKRYLSFLSWKNIAAEMRYSIRHLYRIHDRGLENIKVP